MNKNYIRVICVLLITIPSLAWMGWIFNIEILKRFIPGITPMNPVTAICFVALSVGLYLVRNEHISKEYRLISQILGGLVGVIGAVILLRFLTGLDLGFDKVFFSDKLDGNRLAPNTAFNLIITGIALIFIDISLRGKRPAQHLTLLTLSLSTLAIIGYVYGIRSFYGAAKYVPMALPSAICFILFSVGFLCARPHSGGMKIITAPSVGRVVRRLLLAAVFIPFSLGGIGVILYHRGVYEFAMGIALIITSSAFLSSILIWKSGLSLYDEDLKRLEVQGRLESRTQELELSADDVKSKNSALEETKHAILNILEDLAVEKQIVENEKIKDEALLASIGEAMVAIDIKGDVITVNKQAGYLLGWKIEQLLAINWIERVPMVDAKNQLVPKEKRPIHLALTLGKRVIEDSYLYVRKDKTAFPTFMTASPVVIDGKTTGAILVFRDITRELEVDKAKSEFVSLASHQLRTPLSAIGWYTEMLLAGDAGKINSEQRKYLNEVYKGNQRMVELVNSLLNVSRIDLGTFSVDSEPTQITDIADSVLKDLNPQYTEKQLRVEVEYEKDIPIMSLDPKLTRMIFQNLLSNAVKYTPEKGTVRLCITMEKNPTKHLEIVVADTGYGIPKNQIDKIFTKLFRADNVMEKDTEGTGLGLYLVKSILDSTGGAITFRSREDKGTQFFVTIPMSGMQSRLGNKGLT